MDKLLVIGSAGFLGSSFIRYILSQKKYHIVGVDCLQCNKNIYNIYLNRVQDFYLADVYDKHIMLRIFELNKPDYVINFTSEYNDTLFELCVKFGVKKFVQTYHKDDHGIDDFLSIANNYNLNIKTLIYPNLFGPRQTMDNFIPTIYDCFTDKKPLNVTNDVNDLLFAEDCCAAADLLLNNPCDDVTTVSYGLNYTSFEIAAYIRDYMEKGEIVVDKSLQTDNTVLDNKKIKAMGWKPARKFKDRLKYTINWYNLNQWATKKNK